MDRRARRPCEETGRVILNCGLHLEPHPGRAAATRLLDRGSLNVSLQISVAKFQYGRTFSPSVSKTGLVYAITKAQLLLPTTDGKSFTSFPLGL